MSWIIEENVSDPAAEIINVLDLIMKSTDQYAAQTQDNIVVANVIITPANRTVPTNLTAITFNVTGNTNLNPSCIKSFTLWNDTNANNKFDPGDTPIDTISGGTLDASFTNIRLYIPAGTSARCFLTMNISGAQVNAQYQLKILPQNVVIDQGTGDNVSSNPSLNLTIVKVEEDSPSILVAPGGHT